MIPPLWESMCGVDGVYAWPHRRGRACPARNLPSNPFPGQSVGEGFIPPGYLPAAANGHGGQRAGRPTHDPGRTADLRGVEDAAPYNRCANSPAICRGRACPARNLTPYPFHGQSLGEGFIPPGYLPAAANGHGGQRAGRPTTLLKKPCVGRGALTPPKFTATTLLSITAP